MDQRNLGLVGLEAIALLLSGEGERESWLVVLTVGEFLYHLVHRRWRNGMQERGKQFEVMG